MRVRLVGAAMALIALGALRSPSSAGSTRAQLPNLVALAPFDIHVGEADREAASDVPTPAIRFATGASNRSDHALELSGQPTSATEATAQQCIAWAAPRICTQRKDVGKFAWHADHGHYHFQDFALYQLRKLRSDGEPIMRKRGLVATSGKVSYCIIDVEQEESRGPLYAAPYPLYYSCLAGMSMQGISPGWTDIYSDSTPGQQIPLEGIRDGDYALLIFIDPLNRLYESSDDDNRSLARIRISQDGSEVTVLCVQEPGDTQCGPEKRL